jgi:hypothetical protein
LNAEQVDNVYRCLSWTLRRATSITPGGGRPSLAGAILVALAMVLGLKSSGCQRPATNPPPTYPVRPAPEMLVRRVQAAYAAVKRSARHWPGFEKTEVKAMLIYDAEGEWFFGEARDLRGFHRTGQRVNGAPVTYAQPSLFLSTEIKPYATIRETDGWLGRIGWRDFDPDAPYRRTEPMMILQELEVAMENHPQIESTEDWIGVYVHECFHVFQKSFTDVDHAMRIQSKDEAGDRDAMELLAQGSAYRSALENEFVMLNGAVESSTTKDAAKRRLRRWLDARTKRVHGFQAAFRRAGGGGSLDHVDMAITSSEGTANYVEKMYLAHPDAFVDPHLAADPRSRQYVPPGEEAREIPERPADYPRLENYPYTLGDLVARLLDVADPGWKKTVFKRSNLLIGAVEAAVE